MRRLLAEYLRRGLTTLALCAWLCVPGQARDLPVGAYALAGDLFPAIHEGYTPWVFAHLTISRNTLQWRFVKPFEASAASCAEPFWSCHTVTQNLTQRVRWYDDGRLELLSSDWDDAPEQTINHNDRDKLFFWTELDRFTRNAQLELIQGGFTITPQRSKFQDPTVVALPMRVQDMRDVFALERYLDLNRNAVGQCGLQQMLLLQLAEDLTPAQQGLRRAARYFGEMAIWVARSEYLSQGFIEPAARRAITKRQTEARAWEIALSRAIEAILRPASAPPDEDALIAEIAALIDRLEDVLEERHAPVRTAITQTHRADLLAAARFAAHFERVKQRLFVPDFDASRQALKAQMFCEDMLLRTKTDL